MIKKSYKDVFADLADKCFEKAMKETLEKINIEEPIAFNEPVVDENIEDKYYTAIEKIRDVRDKLVKVTSQKFVKLGKPLNANKKVLSLSDLHIPFENPDVIMNAIKEHSDADVLVLNGDIFEVYALSKWPKKKVILLKHEYRIAVEWMKLFTSIFPKIILVSGNHENRIASYFNANIDSQANFLVSKDILSRLANGYDFNEEEGTFEKVHDWNNVHYDGGLMKYYTIIGKTIFIHPNDFSSVHMRTSVNHADDLMQTEDFECMVMGHTHKMGTYIWKNKLIIEQGCCCVPMDYEKSGRARKSPQAYGAAVVYMDNKGHVDFNKTQPLYYGTGSPIKIGDAMRHLIEEIK